MTTILIRTVLIYCFLILTMRLMGKRQIGELELTDLVTTLLLSEIAALPITNQEIPVSYAVIPMVVLLSLEVLSSLVLIRFPKLKNFVSANPTVIIRGGVLDQSALRSLRISVDELMSGVRQAGLTGLEQVESAILEKNGKLTVLPKSSEAPPSAKDLGVTPPPTDLMHIVFCNGAVSRAGLSLIGKNEEWLTRQLDRRGLSADSLFCVTANRGGDLFWIRKEN